VNYVVLSWVNHPGKLTHIREVSIGRYSTI
jgi:hypothetical protein